MQPRVLTGLPQKDPNLDRYDRILALANQMNAPKQPAKQKGRGGILSSLISELGGAGGAAGGAAIGTAIAPGIGTVIGAGLGGLFGGGGGRVVENKVRDNRLGLGDALKEGALSGILGGAGTAFQLARAGKAATGVKGISNLGKNIAAGGEASVVRQGVLEGTGASMKASSGGYGIGTRLAGQDIGARDSDRIASLLKKLKIPATSPEKSVRLLEPRLGKMGEELSANIAKSNVKFTKGEIQTFSKELANKVATAPGLGKSANNFAAEQVTKLAKVKDLQELSAFRKGLDTAINFNATNLASAEKQKAALILRTGIRDKVNALVPGLAEQNSLYHDATDALTLLKKGAKDIKGGGLVGKVTSLAPVKAAEAKLGAGLESIGKVSAGTGGPFTQVANQLKVQSPAALGRAITGAATPVEEMSVTDQFDPGGFSEDLQVDSGLGGLTGGFAPSAPVQSAYPLEQAIADYQAAPDAKTQKQVMDYYDFVSGAEQAKAKAGGGNGLNVTKVTAQQYGLAQSGQQALENLSELIQTDPGAITRLATPGRQLPIVGGYISKAAGTGDIDAIGYNIADSLLRLRTGAQANESEVKKLQSQIMPRAGDSPKTIQTKLRQIQQIFGSVLQMANSNAGPSVDLTGLSGAF